MNILIQKASLDNLSDIQLLNLLLFKKEKQEFSSDLDLNWTYSNIGTNYFSERISGHNSIIYIAIYEQAIIGYICGAISEAESYRELPYPIAELENMYINESYRGQGIGSKLYSNFLERCSKKGVKKLRVEASIDNHEAIQFYKKQGAHPYSMRLEHDI